MRPESVVLLALVTLQRGAELVVSRNHERKLRARGAVEIGRAHYPLLVMLHAAWLAAIWLLGWSHALNWGWVALFAGLQAARLWVLTSLGERWTTRIIVLPGAPLIRRGPYRFLSHPNYLVVALEIPVLPLAFGLPLTAAVFCLLNLAVLALRISVEGRALKAMSAPA